MNPKHKGEISEAQVIAALMRDGEVVLLPFGDNQRYDLVLDRPEGFVRVQCKTGRLRDGVVRFSTSSSGSTTDHMTRRGYDGEVDFFGVYCPDTTRCYLVPIDDVPGVEASLRVEAPKRNWKAEFRMASEYEIGCHQPPSG